MCLGWFGLVWVDLVLACEDEEVEVDWAANGRGSWGWEGCAGYVCAVGLEGVGLLGCVRCQVEDSINLTVSATSYMLARFCEERLVTWRSMKEKEKHA